MVRTAKDAAAICREWYCAFRNMGKGEEKSVLELLDVADTIEALESAQLKWSSVDDPPKTSGRCLVLFEDGRCCDAEFDENIDFDSKFGEWVAIYDMDTLGFVDSEWRGYQEITHWMPMPQVPEVEE